MGVLFDRLGVLANYGAELVRHGAPESTGPLHREVIFLVDGVGGFQAMALLVRRVLRDNGDQTGTILFKWQFGLPGEIWTDLCWLRRNQWMGRRLARRILAFRREHPDTVIHMMAFSGGTGIAVFACEQLAGRGAIETLILPCPALSSTYDLAPALRSVRRCYALVSSRDRFILGLGTRVFGTTDRKFAAAAGCRGFRIPRDPTDEQLRLYGRMREIRWTPALKLDGHYGGHSSWAGVTFLKRHLRGLLVGEPELDTHQIPRY